MNSNKSGQGTKKILPAAASAAIAVIPKKKRRSIVPDPPIPKYFQLKSGQVEFWQCGACGLLVKTIEDGRRCTACRAHKNLKLTPIHSNSNSTTNTNTSQASAPSESTSKALTAIAPALSSSSFKVNSKKVVSKKKIIKTAAAATAVAVIGKNKGKKRPYSSKLETNNLSINQDSNDEGAPPRQKKARSTSTGSASRRGEEPTPPEGHHEHLHYGGYFNVAISLLIASSSAVAPGAGASQGVSEQAIKDLVADKAREYGLSEETTSATAEQITAMNLYIIEACRKLL